MVATVDVWPGRQICSTWITSEASVAFTNCKQLAQVSTFEPAWSTTPQIQVASVCEHDTKFPNQEQGATQLPSCRRSKLDPRPGNSVSAGIANEAIIAAESV